MSEYYRQMLRDWNMQKQYLSGRPVNANRSPSFSQKDYYMHTNADFGFFQLTPKKPSKPGDWKFHISIHSADVPRAWDIVAEELMRHGDRHMAKVVKPEKIAAFSDSASIQAGKHITVYTSRSYSPTDFVNILARIEWRFRKEGVRPGVHSNADRQIPHSRFVAYRRETDSNGRYMSSSELSKLHREIRYNPYNSHDPFAGVTFERAFPSESKISGEWLEATTGRGERVIRTSVESMSQKEVDDLVLRLLRADLNPTYHVSDTLGMTLRLTGSDVDRFHQLSNHKFNQARKAPSQAFAMRRHA